MVSPSPVSEPSGRIVPVRALIVLVLFVAAVVVLVAVGTRPPPFGSAAPPVTTTTLPGAGHGHGSTSSTTTTTTVPRSSVTVVVANATATAKLAAHYSTQLTAQGWDLQTPTDASTDLPTSAVYYAPGQQEAAAAIATSLSIAPADVLPYSSAVPVSGSSGVDVVVVIGANLVTSATS